MKVSSTEQLPCGLPLEGDDPNTVMINRRFSAINTQMQRLTSGLYGKKVYTPAIASGTVPDGSITTAKLADNAVVGTKILDGIISTLKLANNAVTQAKVAAAAIGTVQLITLSVDSTIIADNAITTPKLTANAVTAAKIAANTITANEIAANTITAAKIVAGTITAAEIASGTILAGNIAANTITAGQILALTITGNEIAANTIVAGKMVAYTLTAGQIAANSITASRLILSTGNLVRDSFLQDIATLDSWYNYVVTIGNVVIGNTIAGWYTETSGVGTSGTLQVPSAVVIQSTHTGPNYTLRHILFQGNNFASMTNVRGGVPYEFSFLSAGSFTGATISIGIEWYNSATTYLSTDVVLVLSSASYGRVLSKFQVTAPGTASYGRIVGDFVPSGTYSGYFAISAFNIHEANGATMIVDGTITAGKIAAGAITTDKLTVGNLTNLVLNGSFEEGLISWTSVGVGTGSISTTTTSIDGTLSLALQVPSGLAPANFAQGVSNRFPVVAGRVYSFKFYATAANLNPSFYARIYYFSDGTTPLSYIDSISNGALTTSWVKYEFTQTAPATAKYAEVQFYNYATSVNNPTILVDGVEFYTQSGTTDIQDGAITTSKLNFTPVASTNVVASINASAEGILIAGNRIQIDGTVTFTSGYNPTTKVASGGAAADVNAGVTKIAGGQIVANSITAGQIAALTITATEIAATSITAGKLNITSLSAITANLGAVTAGTLDVGTSGNRIQITGSGFKVGLITVDGTSTTNTIAFGYTYGVVITGGAAAASITIGAAGLTSTWSDSSLALRSGSFLSIGGNQVVGARQSAIGTYIPGGTYTGDQSAIKTAIDAIRTCLSTHGLTA